MNKKFILGVFCFIENSFCSGLTSPTIDSSEFNERPEVTSYFCGNDLLGDSTAKDIADRLLRKMQIAVFLYIPIFTPHKL
ncbi:hypothetical protein ATH90_3970 [Pseudomonas lurida]|nr:hypothetical protein ATH90_3970 [Pseudomonas lurida]